MNKSFGVCIYIFLLSIPGAEKSSLVLLSLHTVYLIFYSKDISDAYKYSFLDFLLMIFIAFSAASMLMSGFLLRGVKALAPVVPAYIIYFVIIRYLKTTNDIKILFISFVATGLVVALKVLVATYYLGGNYLESQVLVASANTPILITPNDSVFLSIILPFSYAVAISVSSNVIRVLSILNAILVLVISVILHSRSCFFITIFTTVISIFYLAGNKRMIYLSLLVFFIIILEIALGMGISKKIFGSIDITGGRIPLWLVAMQMISEAPIFGFGPNTYGVNYMRILPTILSGDMIVVPGNVRWAHNIFLEIAAERGLVALGLFVAILLLNLRVARNTYISCEGEKKVFVFCTNLSLVASILAGFIELSLMKLWVVILYSVLFSLIGVLNRQLNNQRMINRQ